MNLAPFIRVLVDTLAWPVQTLLLMAVTLVVVDLGIACGEWLRGLAKLEAKGDLAHVDAIARVRIERVDILARVGPMLGLMGTLIPLGPGLAALGQGDVALLAQAVTVAFDTTVLGLLVGIIGFAIGRLRRRWYDQVLTRMERAEEHE
ncbi:MAG: MotA/TolQ/ExbB proton channel family protein [Myxococcota bacterium]